MFPHTVWGCFSVNDFEDVSRWKNLQHSGKPGANGTPSFVRVLFRKFFLFSSSGVHCRIEINFVCRQIVRSIMSASTYVYTKSVIISEVTWDKYLTTYLEVWKRSLKHKEPWGSNFEQVEVGQEELEIMIGFSEHGDDGSKGFFRAHGVIPANLDCAAAIGLIPSQLPLID